MTCRRPPALLSLAMFAVFLLSGCDSAPTHDSVMRDTLSTMEEMVTVLRSVRDEASADAAKPKLQALADRQKELREQNAKLGEPPADKRAAIKKEYEARMQKVMGELLGETMRVGADPKLNTALKGVNTGEAK